MVNEAGGRDDEVADALAYVCGHLKEIRVVLSRVEAEPDGVLQQLLSAVRAGRDVGSTLDALDRVLRAEGDALGVYVHTRGIPFDSPALGDGFTLTGFDEEPWEIIFLCPSGQCSGRRGDEATTFPLRCSITGQELRRERL